MIILNSNQQPIIEWLSPVHSCADWVYNIKMF